MLKKLILIASLFSTLALAASPPTNVEQAYNEIRNQGVNPGAEQGKSGWMVSGGSGTFQIDTDATHARDGKQSFMLSGFGSGVFWEMQAALTMPQAQSCTAKIYYYGGDANWAFQVYDMSGNLLGSQTLATQTSYTTAIVPFQCTAPSSGAYIALQALASTPAAIHVDSTFLGETPLAQISQATYVGGVIVPSGCTFDQSGSGGYADMTNVGSCSGFALVGQAASFDAVGNGSVTFNNLPPGEYMASFQGTCNRGNASTNDAKFVTTDGSSFGTAFDLGTGAQVGGFTMTIPCILYAHFTYSGAANRNFKVQVNPSASDNFTISQIGGISGEFFSLYRYPSSSQIAVSSDLTPGNWSGGQGIASGWSVSSTTPADFSAGSGIVTNQITSRNISCGSAGTDAGISCTLPRTGHYQVCGSANMQTASSVSEHLQLVDGSGTTIQPDTQFIGLTTATPNATVCGQYNAVSVGSPIEFKFKGWSLDGSALSFYSNAISWTVIELDAPMPAPILVGAITAPNGSTERMARVIFSDGASNPCSSSPCTIDDQSGSWVSSVVRASTGTYNVTFNSGIFSGRPTCTANTTTGGFIATVATTPIGIGSIIQVQTFNSSFGVADSLVEMLCMGPQ